MASTCKSLISRERPYKREDTSLPSPRSSTGKRPRRGPFPPEIQRKGVLGALGTVGNSWTVFDMEIQPPL